jgi:hypothetical protein
MSSGGQALNLANPVYVDDGRAVNSEEAICIELFNPPHRLAQKIRFVADVQGNLVEGLGRSLLVYAGAVAAAHAWNRYRMSERSEPELGDSVSATPPVSSSVVENSAACLAERFLIKSNGRMFFVKTGEIDWIEAARPS